MGRFVGILEVQYGATGTHHSTIDWGLYAQPFEKDLLAGLVEGMV
jgi:hypothetical protein